MPTYIPEIVDSRNLYSPKESSWVQVATPSIKAVGRTRAGNPIVIYAHVPNYLSSPKNIEKAAHEGWISGNSGLGILPDKGKAGVDFYVRRGDLKLERNPITGNMDLVIEGDVQLQNRSPESFERQNNE